ncbi:hypothetical protein [Desertibacillus haloalkaliphilus]|uniref:hypothetical protein n=1 Tax=Desertibacillus haloalkaliphilus TaxID=1328930 RepID=UPI001C261829|nr:hypothetical protein [Desertibacillus haloalkaliphilus]MBU8906159.1 hypothetical protein [Desertibacillus haloalkaliphilus]
MNYVTDKLVLRKDLQLNTRVTSAEYDEKICRWRIVTEDGDLALAKYFIPALGSLAAPHTPDIKGLENFAGEQYHTSRWPHEKVDFRGKRVGEVLSEWIFECIKYLETNGIGEIEATPEAEEVWTNHLNQGLGTDI